MNKERIVNFEFLLPTEDELDFEYYSLSRKLQIKFKSHYFELKNSYSFKKNISESNLIFLNFIKHRMHLLFFTYNENLLKKLEDYKLIYENLEQNKKEIFNINNLKHFHPTSGLLVFVLIFYIKKIKYNGFHSKEISLSALFKSYNARQIETKDKLEKFANAYKIILEKVKNNLKCENNSIIDKKSVKFNLSNIENNYKNNNNLDNSFIIENNKNILPKEFEGMKDFFIKELINQKNEFNNFFHCYQFYKMLRESENYENNKKYSFNQLVITKEREIFLKNDEDDTENETPKILKFN
jgi:hypothetical protein